MALSDRAEEILEMLWIAKMEEQREPDWRWLGEDDAFRSLEEKGLVEVRDGGGSLTRAGRKEAEGCVRRHRLAERLLVDVLASGEDEVHRAGCKFEHGLHHGLEERVCTILGHPKFCPHGKPIPPGECCARLDEEPRPLLTTVAQVEKNRPCVIAYLESEDAASLRKLMALGALPGTRLCVRQRFPSFLVEIGASQFAIDEEMARRIYVRRSEA